MMKFKPLIWSSSLAVLVVSSPARAALYFNDPVDVDNTTDWTNYLRLDDLDGDGDLDLVVPNCGGFFFVPAQAQAFRVYLNDGGTFTESTAAVLGASFDAPIRVVAIADIDGDGDKDIYAPSAGGQADRLFVNNGGTFVDEAATRLPAGSTSTSAAARFGDFDGDGDLDLVVALGYAASDNPVAKLLLNDGSGTFTDASANLPATATGQDPDDIDLIDVDRDFDLDILLNAHDGPSVIWINAGAGTFTPGAPLPPGSNNYHYGPSVCDVDNDGDLDIWIDNIGGAYAEQLLLNDGAGLFSNATGQVTGNPGADDNGVVCVDIDDDGDFDAAIPSLSGNERILINDSSGNFNLALNDNGFPTVDDPTLWLAFGDLDGDGRLDAVTGQGENVPEINLVYMGNSNQPVDTTPPKIIAVEPPPETVPTNTVLGIRYAVSDRVVTDSGPQLQRAYAKVSVDGASAGETEAAFMGGDLFRAPIPGQPQEQSSVSVELCATDRQGNDACAPAVTYQIMGQGTGGAGGAGTGGASSGPGATGSGGADDDGLEVDDDGCGCSLPGRQADPRALLLLVGIAALALRRRR